MAMHYLHSMAIYTHGENPRIILMSRRLSDVASIGTPVVWTARVPILPPIARTPRASFQAALEQLPDLTEL